MLVESWSLAPGVPSQEGIPAQSKLDCATTISSGWSARTSGGHDSSRVLNECGEAQGKRLRERMGVGRSRSP